MGNANLSNEDINLIISSLALPDEQIQVAVDFANNKTTSAQVEAFAKLAGSTWTYYVRSLDVVIGRTSEPATDINEVQIDLGPAKVVSRKHATIKYNGEFWELTVSGRNGVKVDRVPRKEGTTRLHSGSVLEIGGVQMMFVLPNTKPKIAAGFIKRLHQVAPGSSTQQVNGSSVIQNDPFRKSPSSSSAQVSPLLPLSGQFQASYPAPAQPPMGMYPAPQQQMVPGQLMPVRYANAPPYMPPQQLPMPPQYDHASNIYPYNPAIQNGYGSQFVPGYEPPTATTNTAYPKGVAMVSRPLIQSFSAMGNQFFDQDLSVDDAKDIKPPFSYATMISQAILSTSEHIMSLADIYDWISTKYSFYRFSKSGWQNSIRHNLSLNKAFEKVPRRADEPGKGMKWQIVQQFKEDFQKKASQGDHIKGKSSIAQIQRQVNLRLNNPAPPARKLSNALVTPTIILATDPVDVEAATVVANLATSPQRMGHDIKAPISPFKVNLDVIQGKDGGQNKDTFVTPRKQPIRAMDQGLGIGTYSDQYDLTGGFNGTVPVSDTGNSNILNSLSTPSPSHRYSAGPVTQLGAYTPERGSTLPVPNWRNGLPPSVTKMPEMTPLNKTISDESLTKSVGNSSNSSASSSNSSTDTASTEKTAESSSASITGIEGSKPNSINRTSNNDVLVPPHIITSSVASVSQTPAPMQSNLQLMAPTSAQQQQLPSSFMPASSPAPFWRFMSSTPIRTNDFSPTKFSSPPVSSLRDRGPGVSSSLGISSMSNGGSSLAGKRAEEGLGDLQNVDLTR